MNEKGKTKKRGQIIDHYKAVNDATQALIKPSDERLEKLAKSNYVLGNDPARDQPHNWYGKYLVVVKWLASPLQYIPEDKEVTLTPLASISIASGVYALFVGLAFLFTVASATLPRGPATQAAQISQATLTAIWSSTTIMYGLYFVPVYDRFLRICAMKNEWALLKILVIAIVILINVGAIFVPTIYFFGSVSLSTLSTAYSKTWFVVLFDLVFIITPSSALVTFVLVDSLVWFFWSTGKIAFQIMNYHNSISDTVISKLAFEVPIKLPDTSKSMTLFEFEKKELEAIHKWAEANKDGTDKRFMPTVLGLAALQAIGISTLPIWSKISETIQAIYLFLENLVLGLHLGSMFYGVLIGLIGAFLIWIMQLMGSLFINVAVQDLIIEACIVVEYEKASNEAEQTRGKSIKSSENVSFKSKFKNFIKNLID